MRILIVSQYFWPENFRINDIVKFFTSKGYSVDVLTSYPNYPEGKIFENYKKNPNNFKTYFGANVIRIPVALRKKSTNHKSQNKTIDGEIIGNDKDEL